MEKLDKSISNNLEDFSPKTGENTDFIGNLKPQHQSFVLAYIETFNAKISAIRAGFAPKHAKAYGYQLLQRPEIKAEIDRITQLKAEHIQVDQYMIVEQLQKIAFADLTDYVSWDENGVMFLDPEKVDGQVIAEIDVSNATTVDANGKDVSRTKRKIKLQDKLKAIELLGRHLGMFNNKIDVNGTVNVQIIDDIQGTP